MLGLRHVAWALPEKLNWLKSVALIFVTIDLTSQYKITSLTWFGTEILSLCGLFSQLTEQILFTRPCYQFITSCCLLWPVQILAETHLSVHGSSFLAHDPDTVGTFPVPPDPTGKVSTSLFLISFFEQFAAPMRRFTQAIAVKPHLTLISSHSWLNELIRSGSVPCGILISTFHFLQPVWFYRKLRLLQCMDPATVRHPSVDTFLLMLIPSITPPLISTPIITTPRPPSLHLKGPGDIPTPVDLVCLQLHRASPIWNVCSLMR